MNVAEALRRQREDLPQPLLRSEPLGKGHQLTPVSLTAMAFAHIKAGQLGLALGGIWMERHTSHEVTIDLQHPIVLDALQDVGTRAADEFLAVDRLADQRHDR